MNSIFIKLSVLVFSFFISTAVQSQEFQGKAYYISKSTMDLGNWGARLSEAQKKQVMARMKNRLEKSYTLSFNKEASIFEEEDKLDAMSGATDSWGSNFAQGKSYKNLSTQTLVQKQEFYGKQFLVKDKLLPLKWNMTSETKKIGEYICYKATASMATNDLTWYAFSWDKMRNKTDKETASADNETMDNVAMTEIEAWYTMQIPISNGPSEYWGLPGLILEVSAGDTTMLCSKIILNSEDNIKIEAPDKGKVVTKDEYEETVMEKMIEFRNNRMGRRQ